VRSFDVTVITGMDVAIFMPIDDWLNRVGFNAWIHGKSGFIGIRYVEQYKKDPLHASPF
jgi:hypothetical protein